MKLIFTNIRNPKSVDDLTIEEKEQIVIAGNLYHGEEYSAEILSAKEDDENYEEEISFYSLEICDIVDENGELKYKLFSYMVDSGTLFEGNSTKVAGEVIQCGFECSDDELCDLLLKAQKEAKSKYKNCEFLGVNFDWCCFKWWFDNKNKKINHIMLWIFLFECSNKNFIH